MNYDGFIKQVGKGKIYPAYLFEGEEDYLKEKALKALKVKLISPEYRDFNYEVFFGSEVSPAQIVESVSTPPFRERWRLVVLREVDKLTNYGRKALDSYLDSPLNTTCLVFAAGKLDKRKSLYRLFSKKTKLVSFYPLREDRIFSWVKERARKWGREITPEALAYLVERTGNDLRSLESEIEKLSIFIHPRRIIRREDAEQITEKGGGAGVFDLTEAFREKNLAQSLFILLGLLERGEDPLRIFVLIVREVRILLRIKEKEGELSAYQACPIVFEGKSYYTRFHADIARKYIQAVKKFTLSELISDYEGLVETEASIKTGREDPDVALQRMILNILVH